MTEQLNLFVYGTLAPGQPNERQLSDVPGSWTPATVRGKLYQLGWGGISRYPGIVLDEKESEVMGQIFSSNELSEHWSRLDDFEGSEYNRVITRATLVDGSTEKVFIYALRPGVQVTND